MAIVVPFSGSVVDGVAVSVVVVSIVVGVLMPARMMEVFVVVVFSFVFIEGSFVVVLSPFSSFALVIVSSTRAVG